MRVILAALLLLAGCSDQMSPEEQAIEDERDIRLVEQANDIAPPLEEVTPEPISYPDMERYDLYGEACNYAPGTSLGTRVIAREADAFMKIDGEIERFAADPGARDLPMHSRSLYTSKKYSLRLQIAGTAEDAENDAADYEGTVTLRDEYGRIVYEGSGLARCGNT